MFFGRGLVKNLEDEVTNLDPSDGEFIESELSGDEDDHDVEGFCNILFAKY